MQYALIPDKQYPIFVLHYWEFALCERFLLEKHSKGISCIVQSTPANEHSEGIGILFEDEQSIPNPI